MDISLPVPLARTLQAAWPTAAILLATAILFPIPWGVALQGFVVGLLGALAAVGMALVYRANRVLNFAQVQLGLAPTVLTVSLALYSGMAYLLAVGLGLLGALVVGVVVEVALIRRFARAPRLILTVATIGVAQLLAALALFLPGFWHRTPTAEVLHVPWAVSFSVFPLVFSADHVVAMVVAPLSLAAVAYLLLRTRLGMAVRASAERADRAALLGVPVGRLQTVVWALAAVLSFVAVLLQAGILGLPIGAGFSYTVLLAAFGALVLGRFADLPAVALAAMAIGVLEQGVLWNRQTDPGFVNVVLAVVVIAGLLVRRSSRSRADRDVTSSWAAADEVRPVPRELAGLAVVRWTKRALAAGVAVALLVLPLLLSGDAGNQLKASAILVSALVAASVVVLTGWSGQVSLGQVAFVALGAAVGATATSTWHLDLSLALLLAGLAAALAGAVVSLPTLRLRGIFPAVTTLAVAMATSAYLLNPDYAHWIPVGRVERRPLFGVLHLEAQDSYYYLCLAVAALVVLSLRGIRSSRPGRAMLAIRENDAAASSFGINVASAKVQAFAISGFVAGVAGCLWVHLLQAYSLDLFGPDASVTAFTTAVVGGLGSLPGALLGAVWLRGSQWFFPNAQWQLLASAVGVLLVLMVLPGGLAQLVYGLRDGLLRRLAKQRGIVVPSLLADVGLDVPPAVRAEAVVAVDTPVPMDEASAEAALRQER